MATVAQESVAFGASVGAGISVPAQVASAWISVQTLFGTQGRSQYAAIVGLANAAKGIRS